MESGHSHAPSNNNLIQLLTATPRKSGALKPFRAIASRDNYDHKNHLSPDQMQLKELGNISYIADMFTVR